SRNRRAGDQHVAVDRQSGAVGGCSSASATDHYTVSAGVGGRDTRQAKTAARLTSKQARAFEPLISQTRPARGHGEASGCSGTVCLGDGGNRDQQVLVNNERGAVGNRVAASSSNNNTVDASIGAAYIRQS